MVLQIYLFMEELPPTLLFTLCCVFGEKSSSVKFASQPLNLEKGHFLKHQSL